MQLKGGGGGSGSQSDIVVAQLSQELYQSGLLLLLLRNLHRVDFEGMLLKPNMVISGKKCPVQAGAEEIAEATVRCLTANVPEEVPGIAFLSGGQSLSLIHI